MQIMVMCKSLESPIMENGKLMQTYMQLQYAVQKQSLYNSNKLESQFRVLDSSAQPELS